MPAEFTETQKRRITELNGSAADSERVYEDAKARDQAFRELEKTLVRERRRELK